MRTIYKIRPPSDCPSIVAKSRREAEVGGDFRGSAEETSQQKDAGRASARAWTHAGCRHTCSMRDGHAPRAAPPSSKPRKLLEAPCCARHPLHASVLPLRWQVASAADEHPPPVLNNAYVPKSSPRRLFSSTMFAGVATALLLLGLLLWQMYLSAGPMGAVSICLAASLGVAVGRTQTL